MITFCNRKFIGVFGILLLTPILSLSAQQKKYSLRDFIDSAQHHLPLLLQKKAMVDAAKAGVTDARHAFLPTSYLGDQVTVGTDNSLPGSYLSFGVIPSSSSGVRNSNIYQSAIGDIAFFSNTYELLDFGLKKSTVRSAQAYTGVTQADLDREIYLVKWQVSKLYLEILKNQFQLAIDRENISRYETLYSVIQAVTQSGIKPGADSALAMAELSKTRITYNQTLGQIRELQQQLSYLSGIRADAINIDTSRTSSYLSVPGVIDGSSINGSRDSTGAANPLIDYFNKEKGLYLQREDLVKKSYLPRVMLSGVAWGRGSSIDYNDAYGKSASTGLGYQRFNYLGALTLEYDLFNIVHRKDKERIARDNTLASQYGLEQQQLSLQNVGNKADEAIRTAASNLTEIPIQISSAESAYAQKTAQYKAGIINLIDLTNASFVLYRSQSDYVQAMSDWLLANLDKHSAAGDLDQFIQSIK